jgi:hypothetical protein
MARWIRKVKSHDPPVITAKSVYSLSGRCSGSVVYVVAPGPSLDDFPRDRLKTATIIAVNSAVEVVRPTWWIFQEGMFCKKYHPVYTSRRVKAIVTTETRCQTLAKLLSKPKELYFYSYRLQSVLRMRRDTGKIPFWANRESSFLPGRCSVAANAISLAVLMSPSLIVLVGVDLSYNGEKYYCEGIRRNPGPNLRHKALIASKAWMSKAAQRKVWAGPRIITTSKTLRLRGIHRVSVETALKETEICESVCDNKMQE